MDLRRQPGDLRGHPRQVQGCGRSVPRKYAGPYFPVSLPVSTIFTRQYCHSQLINLNPINNSPGTGPQSINPIPDQNHMQDGVVCDHLCSQLPLIGRQPKRRLRGTVRGRSGKEMKSYRFPTHFTYSFYLRTNGHF